MKSFLNISTVLVVAVLPMMACAQSVTFSNLFIFQPTSSQQGTNSTGAHPHAGVLLVSNALYGTTYGGGTYGQGTIFRINPDGSGFTNLYSFNTGEGSQPGSELLLWSNTLYGTCPIGGSGNSGTIFRINLDGTGFTTVANGNFDVLSGLVLSSNIFYGTTDGGGSYGYGIAFQINPDGTGFTNFHDFFGGSDGTSSIIPSAGLIVSSNDTFYGTADGNRGYGGTVFKLVGSNLTVLHGFTNSENPQCRLVLSGNTLYGTAPQGGDNGYGIVFEVNTDGSGYTNLHNFSYDDGSYPQNGLILSNGILYGTTTQSAGHSGTVFQMNTDGTGFKILHNFAAFSIEGGYPVCDLFLSGNSLYGTTSGGGPQSGDTGSVFVINLPVVPRLDFQTINNSIVLSWTDSGFSLQSATTVNGAYSTIQGAASPYTNTITGSQHYFRLQGN